MKKIYSFIALMLMCFAGNANAQDAPMSWNYAEESVSEDDFIGGEEHFYVLQEGDNTNENGEAGPHSASGFLSCMGGCSADVTTNNVFKFILTGEEKEGHPIFVLKSVAKNAYLASDGSYVKYTAEAFQFSVRKGVNTAEDAITEETPWIEYSCAVSGTRSVNAVTLGAWVMCSKDSRTYIGFWGSEPQFAGYIDTNNWLIKVATPQEMPIEEQFTAVFNKYFIDFGTKEDVAAAYPVGTNPGYVTQELQNNLMETFEIAYAMLVDGGATPEQYKEMIARIEKLFGEDMQNGLIKVAPGYFILKNIDNQQRGFLTVTADGKKGRGNKALATNNVVEGTDYASWTLESTTEWNLSNAKYIWKVEDGGNGKFLFKNFGTGKYLASNEDFTMNAEPAGAYEVKNYKGMEFYLTLQNGKILHVANHSDNKLMTYNADDPASRWYFYTVNQEIIDSLTGKVAQNALNDELKAAVANAKSDYYSLQYANYVEGDMYVAGDSGLVTSMYKYNSMATQEGGADKLFDGDMKSYFHTAWNASDVEAQGTEVGTHWIKVDLGKAVSNLKVKFTKRQGAANGHVSQYALYALPEGDNAESTELGELVAKSVDSIAFQYGNNNTHIADYELSQPTRFLRFEVLQTRGKDSTTWNAMTAETGPFWHMSELRFYDPADIKANPAYAAIPADVKEALKAAIDKAEAELKDKKAQKSTIEELEAALKKYWDCYPDASELKSTLESAAQMASNAAEGTEIGFYEVGATDALLEVVNSLQKVIDEKEAANAAFTLDELKSYQEQLDKAVADFNAKLQLPEAGKVYMMVGKSLAPANAEGNYPPQVDGLIASVNADVMNGSPVFRYNLTSDDAIDGRFNALWLVEKTETGLAFKNLANGLYMNNVYEGLTEEEIEKLELPNNQIGWSKTPKSFTLEQFTKEGQGENGYFVMTLKKGQYLNFQQDGRVMVHYGERNDNNAPFVFVEADDAMTFEGNYNINVEPGKVQILSFPVAFEGVQNTEFEPNAYQVLGKKDNKIMLSLIEGAIPAGTPFIIQTKAANAEENFDGEKMIQATLAGTSVEENLNLEYNYEPVVVNGLVSTPNSEKLAAGYGVIVGNKVIPCEEGRAAVAGSGVFNKDIPATDVDAEFFIETEGEITAGGNATAVEELEIVKNVPADVYTLTGVKVRHNVKMSNATQGLPKGVYIVGGKKVIVK